MIYRAKKQLAKKIEEWRKQDESERAEQAKMTEGEGPSDTVPWFFCESDDSFLPGEER